MLESIKTFKLDSKKKDQDLKTSGKREFTQIIGIRWLYQGMSNLVRQLVEHLRVSPSSWSGLRLAMFLHWKIDVPTGRYP